MKGKSNCHRCLLGQSCMSKEIGREGNLHILCVCAHSKWILNIQCGNGQENDGYSKPILLEMCSIRTAGLLHPVPLMLHYKHINLMLHQPSLHLVSGNVNLQQNSAATCSHITVEAVAYGSQVPFIFPNQAGGSSDTSLIPFLKPYNRPSELKVHKL